ncbi:MAG: response regulator [Anaeroplasmataceae bacterium]|nr:response regulator [Anaeroplasmataceae bacterium]
MKKNFELSAVYQEIPGGLLIYHAYGNEEIIYANDELIQLFGCDSLEDFRSWTHNSFQGVVHPEDLEKVESSILKQLSSAENKLDHVVYRIIRKDNKIRYVEDFGKLVHDEEHGDIFYVFLTDITTSIQEKEKVQNDTLEQAREKAILKAALETTVYSYREIYIINLEENRYHHIYPQNLEKQKQGIFTDMIKQRVENKEICEENKDWILEIFDPKHIQMELTDKNTIEYQYRRSYNDLIEWCVTTLTVFERNDSLPISVIVGIRSIEDILKKEIQQKEILELALTQAKKASIAKSTFLDNMSHDMRTPMNAILGYTEIAFRNLQNSNKLEDCLNQIHQASHQLLGIINDALDFSQFESGKVGLTLEDYNLLELILDLQNSFTSSIKEKKIKFTLDTSSIKHPVILGDKQKLNQILSNVISNAIKYTKNNGEICFVITEKKTSDKKISEYNFTIKDTGIGMKEDFIAKAFEPFERENNTTISKITGIGLGLAITKNLVDLMKGTININSQVGVGTEVIINVPLEHRLQSEIAQDSSSIEDQAIALLKGKHALIVEDNEINREIIKEIFSLYEVQLDEAEDGHIAVQKVIDHPKYDFIMMDIQMPVMGGYEATKAIRKLKDQEKNKTPIIAISANAFYEDKQKSLEVGMNAHVAKPIDIQLVLKTLYETLENSRL